MASSWLNSVGTLAGYTQPLEPAAAFGPLAETSWPKFGFDFSDPEVLTCPANVLRRTGNPSCGRPAGSLAADQGLVVVQAEVAGPA